jgi:site-specific DNA-methyltransferase (adenine-specific)
MSVYKTEVYQGDSREVLKKYPEKYFNLIVTSPPYADARKEHYDSISQMNMLILF